VAEEKCVRVAMLYKTATKLLIYYWHTVFVGVYLHCHSRIQIHARALENISCSWKQCNKLRHHRF